MTRQRRTSRGLIALASALLLTSCAMGSGSGGSYGNTPDDDESPAVASLIEENLIGTWGSTDDRKPNLTFEEGGTVNGSDGCNRLVGGWSLENETVTLTNLAGTLMACEGVDTWLRDAASAVLAGDDDDELSVLDSDGTEIGTLERED